MRTMVALAVAALTLSACETATPYQMANQHDASTGYSDQQIEANRWRVTFSGNSLTSRETVERYLLFRSAELTLNQGFDWFEAADRHTNRSSSYVGDTGFGGGFGGGYGYGYGGFGGYWGPSWGLYGGGGWGYGGPDPFFGGPVDIEQVSRYQAAAEIVMGHGPKPTGNVRAFTARSVVDHLQPSIKYPKP